MDLWVWIHDLRAGFMTEKVVQEVGNYIGTFVESCQSNFTCIWREFLRVRVKVDLEKPLKRRMKVRKAGNEWFWIVFKYENAPTFCFICGILGHSDKFCSRLFDTLEEEIAKPYGVWMRAPLRRQTKLIDAKWLVDGRADDRNLPVDGLGTSNRPANIIPPNQGFNFNGENQGGKTGFSNEIEIRKDKSQQNPTKKGVTVIENKKRRTDDGLDQVNDSNLNTELDLGSEEGDGMSIEQDVEKNPNIIHDPKNVKMAGLIKGVRQAL